MNNGSPNSSTASSVAHLGERRSVSAWEAKKRANPDANLEQHEQVLEPGTVLIQQGQVYDNPAAIYVIQGSLHERLRITHHDAVVYDDIFNIVGERGLAFSQALFGTHATAPAMFSVIVPPGGAVVATFRRDLMHLLVDSGHVPIAAKEFERSLKLVERLRTTVIDRAEDADGFNVELLSSEERLEAEIQRTMAQIEENDRLREQLEAAKSEAALHREASREAVENLTEISEQLRRFGLGMELVEILIQKTLARHGITERPQLNVAMMQLLSGEEPKRMQHVQQEILEHRQSFPTIPDLDVDTIFDESVSKEDVIIDWVEDEEDTNPGDRQTQGYDHTYFDSELPTIPILVEPDPDNQEDRRTLGFDPESSSGVPLPAVLPANRGTHLPQMVGHRSEDSDPED
ncbi:hypothetical protein GF380_06605 [Candidatus Uhrbacteria bacterium]|nr:hypothetical protein [Candidatus Uhrbacteria bacterium]MBD3284605.1 hypothetical protein [Candidatus Uhrbacteria bacterium]